MADSKVIIFDTTLRDGEQSPGCSMNLAEKLRMARQLDRLGVDVIEAGFPIASDGDFEAVKAVAAAIRHSTVAGLARAVPGDIDRAWEALAAAAHPRIHVFLATSDLHLEHKLRIDRATCLTRVRESVQRARRYTPDVEFSAEDATRSDLDFLCQVAEVAVEAGATAHQAVLDDDLARALVSRFEAQLRRIDAEPERPSSTGAESDGDGEDGDD